MTNGFEISISESDFKAKTQDEQGWILFQGVTAIRKYIDNMDQYGCEYGKKKYQMNWMKVTTAIATGMTGALGIVYIVYKIIFQ